MKDKLLKIIETETFDLHKEDVEGHIWWNRFKELVEGIPESNILESLSKFKGGSYYSGRHNEFRTSFLGDWNDIENEIKKSY